jgi:hypothetical protein
MFSLFAAVTNVPVVAFTLDWAVVVQILLAVAMPVLVGLVTTRVTASNIKAWLLATLTLVTSLLTELLRSITTSTPFDLGIALLAVIPAFVISVSTYYGLWKPTGIAGAAQDVEATKLVK